jgi:arylsulfatase A-like enzyme
MKNMRLLIFISAFIVFSGNAFAQSQPNVVLIVVDDLNDFVGEMDGYIDAHTPQIDNLINEGTLFANAHSNATMCNPSRPVILTGIHPITSKHIGIENWQQNNIIKNCKLISEYMHDNGYTTYKTGKIQHWGDKPSWFNHYRPGSDYGPTAWNGTNQIIHPLTPQAFKDVPDIGNLDGTYQSLAQVPSPGGWWSSTHNNEFNYVSDDNRDLMPDEESVEWFEDQIDLLEEEDAENVPFFTAVGIVKPHTPLTVPQHYYDLFPLDSIIIPERLENDDDDLFFESTLNSPSFGRAMHDALEASYEGENDGLKIYVQAYLACVAFADSMVGRIVNKIDSSSFADNTIIILISDHGYHLGQKDYIWKNTLWEESTKIPFIIRHPDFPGNQRVDHPISLVDLFPTISDLCDLSGTTTLNSNGVEPYGHSLVPFLENPDTHSWEGHDVAVTIASSDRPFDGIDDNSDVVFENHLTVRSKDYRYILYSTGEEELYDYTADENEWTNQAGNHAFTAVKMDLISQLHQSVSYYEGDSIEDITVPTNDDGYDFIDSLQDFSRMYSHEGLVQHRDLPGLFNNDYNRISQTSNGTGTIIYHLDSIADFKIEYWQWNNPTVTGSIKIYGSSDNADYEGIEIDLNQLSPGGNRYFYQVKPSGDIPENTNYLKIELSGNNDTWKDQIGKVLIKSSDFISENGSENVPEKKINIYSSDKVLYVSNPNDVNSISVYDVSGKLLSVNRLSDNDELGIVNCADLISGVYLVVVQTEHNIRTKRIFIE